MTKLQANKALYLVAVLSVISLIVEILTLSQLYGLLFMAPMLGVISAIGAVILILFIVSPFLRQNKILFLVVVNLLLGNSYHDNIQSLYDYFTGTADLATVGIVPGLLISCSTVALDTTGLILLILRCVGYLKEHRAGLKTQF